MFEKEAEEFADCKNSFWRQGRTCIDSVRQAFQKGAEFGYNKANEWHYVSKGEMPTDEKTILIYLEARFVLGWYKFGFWYSNDGEIEEDVIAWKEIVLPKEIEQI